jgi:BASS family bile acid:Na+ symporter
MEAIAKLLPVLIQASLFLLVFAVGLRARLDDALSLFRQPGLLLRSLLAMNVVVPLFAAGLAAAFDLNPVVKIALILMAISPLPPTIPKKEFKLGGQVSYVVGLLVAVSVLSIVIIPATLAILSAVFGADVRISAAEVARAIWASILLPLALGIAVRSVAESFAERAAQPASGLGMILLLVGVLPILVKVWPAMAHLIGNGTVLAMLAVTAVGLLAGHLLGGPDPVDQTVLAIASASRHPGIALLIGEANFPEHKPQVTAAVLLFLLVSGIAAAPYSAWRKRLLAERAGSAEPTPGPRTRRPA